jgi:hypothetical protein
MRTSIRRGLAAAAIGASALGVGAAGIAATAGTASAATASTTAVVKPAVTPVAPLDTWVQLSLTTTGGTTYTGYWLLLEEGRGGLLSGWLYDPNLPAGPDRYLAVSGAVSGDVVVFEVTYNPTYGQQGSRAFVGIISGGNITGRWTETGTEDLSGTWTA